MLIASFMVDDWQECLAKMKQESTENAEQLLRCIYSSLLKFTEKHSSLFGDADAAKVFAIAFSERHKILRDQLAEIILPLTCFRLLFVPFWATTLNRQVSLLMQTRCALTLLTSLL